MEISKETSELINKIEAELPRLANFFSVEFGPSWQKLIANRIEAYEILSKGESEEKFTKALEAIYEDDNVSD